MIIAKNITKKFDEFIAVDSLSCSIPKGCIYGLVGSNGAGKSTFLRIITGIYKPDSGYVEIDGQPVYDNPGAKKKFTFVPDELYFLPQSNMNRMAMLYEANYESFDRKRYRQLVAMFDLNPTANLNTFSKGMRRQAATVLALSCRPEYIFFDETFDGLDPIMRNLVKKVIYGDVCERQTTAIITSHSLRELEDTCDQLTLLHKGGLILESEAGKLSASLFKVQVVFDYDYDRSLFKGLEILDFKKNGSVSNIIIRGDQQTVKTQIHTLSPLMAEILPLSLEEVFIYEMEALGYAFSGVLDAEVEENEK
ncbi:MAG: ABC transporter ATP-binding protein [Christensenellales bacterium]|jgi:ABC-2 type transport system ATP-binding protein